MLAMHTEDSADDALIAEEWGHHAVTRSQSQAVERAARSPFIAPTIDLTPPPQKMTLAPDTVSPPAPIVTPPHVRCPDRTLRDITEQGWRANS